MDKLRFPGDWGKQQQIVEFLKASGVPVPGGGWGWEDDARPSWPGTATQTLPEWNPQSAVQATTSATPHYSATTQEQGKWMDGLGEPGKYNYEPINDRYDAGMRAKVDALLRARTGAPSPATAGGVPGVQTGVVGALPQSTKAAMVSRLGNLLKGVGLPALAAWLGEQGGQMGARAVYDPLLRGTSMGSVDALQQQQVQQGDNFWGNLMVHQPTEGETFGPRAVEKSHLLGGLRG